MSIRPVLLNPAAVLLIALVAAGSFCLGRGDCTLLSPDRNAYRAFEQQDFGRAARDFVDPLWRATALFREGEFEQAAAIWSGADTAEGVFNHANALLMQGQYDLAAERYGRALEIRPGWVAAQDNREIALSRAAALVMEGADMTGGKMSADDFDFSSSPEKSETAGEETEQGELGSDDAALREIWLRQVQTRPADFLRSKFAYQYATRSSEAQE